MSDYDKANKKKAKDSYQLVKQLFPEYSQIKRLSEEWRTPIYSGLDNSGETLIIKFLSDSNEDKIIEILNTRLKDIAPRVLDLKYSQGGFFLVYEKVDNLSVLEESDRLQLKDLITYFNRMGEIAAWLHSIDTQKIEIKLQNYIYPQKIKFIDNYLSLEAMKCVQYTKELNKAALIHGDFGPQQFLIQKDKSIKLIDWETVKVGNPSEDIAWFLWTTFLHTNAFKDLYKAFIKGYEKYSPWHFDKEMIQKFAVAKIWSVLPQFEQIPHEDIHIAWRDRLKKALGKEFLHNLEIS